MVGNTTVLWLLRFLIYYFCDFWFVAINIMYQLQFLVFENLYSPCLVETTKKSQQKETSKIQKYKRDNT